MATQRVNIVIHEGATPVVFFARGKKRRRAHAHVSKSANTASSVTKPCFTGKWHTSPVFSRPLFFLTSAISCAYVYIGAGHSFQQPSTPIAITMSVDIVVLALASILLLVIVYVVASRGTRKKTESLIFLNQSGEKDVGPVQTAPFDPNDTGAGLNRVGSTSELIGPAPPPINKMTLVNHSL
jgi:hypothetical protein